MKRWIAALLKFLGFGPRSEVEVVQPSGLEFPSLDLDALAEDLHVVRMGQRNGGSGIPGTNDSVPDGYEAKLHSELGKRVETARGRAGQIIRNLETSIKARQLSPAVKRCNEIPDAFVRERDVQTSKLDQRIKTMESELADVEREMKEYRSRHGISRPLRITEEEDRNNRWALLILFTVGQLLANAVLFGEGSDYGLALGLTFALIFAFADIIIHFILGDVSARVQAPDRLSRSIGIGATLAWIATVGLVNVSMVHLRLVTRGYGFEGWERWLPSIRDATFAFQDFLSWALLFVGLACSLLAVRSGFTWDEPIPTLRGNGRRALRMREDLHDLREERYALATDLLERFQGELDSIDRRAEDHVSVISDSKNRIDQVVSEFASYCVTAKNATKALVKTYRDENRRHRTEAVPEYFGTPVHVEFSAELDASVESLKKVVIQSDQDHDELRARLPRARKRLRSLAKAGSLQRGSKALETQPT